MLDNLSIQAHFQGRIVGGADVTDPTEFPFFGNLRWTPTDGPLCSGSLLDRSHFLTAAHCASRPVVSLGFAKRVRGRGDKGEFLDVAFCKSHPKTKKNPSGVTQWDFKVCRLRRPVKFSKSVQPITLGTQIEYEKYVVTSKADCYVRE